MNAAQVQKSHSLQKFSNYSSVQVQSPLNLRQPLNLCKFKMSHTSSNVKVKPIPKGREETQQGKISPSSWWHYVGTYYSCVLPSTQSRKERTDREATLHSLQ